MLGQSPCPCPRGCCRITSLLVPAGEGAEGTSLVLPSKKPGQNPAPQFLNQPPGGGSHQVLFPPRAWCCGVAAEQPSQPCGGVGWVVSRRQHVRASLCRWAARGRAVPRWMGTAASSSARSSRSSMGSGSAQPPTRWPASAPPPLSTYWVSCRSLVGRHRPGVMGWPGVDDSRQEGWKGPCTAAVRAAWSDRTSLCFPCQVPVLTLSPTSLCSHSCWQPTSPGSRGLTEVTSRGSASGTHRCESPLWAGCGVYPLGPSALGLRAPHLLRVKHPPRAHHDWVSLSVPVGAQHLLVENLQPDMSYQFSVLAQNKLGSGPFSQIVTSVPRGKRGLVCSPKQPPSLPQSPQAPGEPCCPHASALTPASPFSSGFPVTTVPPEPPAMTMHVFLSPPQALTANETVRGVLLQWEPPAQFSVALSGYALELRQDKGGWEVLDRSIPSTKTQVLVPGLIKVGISPSAPWLWGSSWGGCSSWGAGGDAAREGVRSAVSLLPGAGASGDAAEPLGSAAVWAEAWLATVPTRLMALCYPRTPSMSSDWWPLLAATSAIPAIQ